MRDLVRRVWRPVAGVMTAGGPAGAHGAAVSEPMPKNPAEGPAPLKRMMLEQLGNVKGRTVSSQPDEVWRAHREPDPSSGTVRAGR